MEDKMSPLLHERRVLFRNKTELVHQLNNWPQTQATAERTRMDIQYLDVLYSNCINKIKIEYLIQQKNGIFWQPSKELLDELTNLPTIQDKPTHYKNPKTPQL